MNLKRIYRLFPLSFSITGQGILSLLMVVLVLLAALNTSNNLLFIILATMISAFIVSSIISRNSLKQVSLSYQVPEKIFAGDKVPVKMTLSNTNRVFPSLSVGIEDLGRKKTTVLWKKIFERNRSHPKKTATDSRNGFQLSAYFPVLRPGETHSELTLQSFPHRGIFRLEGFRVFTRFPFGLFQRNERIAVQGEVLVYPSIKDISTYFQRLPFLQGLLESIQKGQGENLLSIRPYMEGDSARVIDWKATAKTRGLMAREFAREEENRICLILDTQTHEQRGGNYREEFEKAVSLTASIAEHFIGLEAGIEFLTPYFYIPLGSDRHHLYRILRFLATVEYTTVAPETDFTDWQSGNLPGIGNGNALKQILSDKVFKIILTSRNREAFPSYIRRSSHIIFFSEL